MNKVLYFIASVAVLASAFACKPDDKDKIDDQTGTKTRIAQLCDQWDWWDFVYDANGKIEKVDRGNGDRVWNFAWTGNNCAVTGRDEFTFTLGANGMISTLNFKGVYTYTYDADGHMTEAKKDGAVVSTITITDGNITKVVEGENTFVFTYTANDNVNGIQMHYQDRLNAMLPSWYRFMIESGLMGKASAKIPATLTVNGTKVCDYSVETRRATEAEMKDNAGISNEKDYVFLSGKEMKSDGSLTDAFHCYTFEEYK